MNSSLLFNNNDFRFLFQETSKSTKQISPSAPFSPSDAINGGADLSPKLLQVKPQKKGKFF